MAPTSFYSPAHYALIAGHGRSGTNWLLHLLDRSATTHCRNEPNEIAGNAFAALPTPFVPIADGDADAFAGPWSQAVMEAAGQMGDRDRAVATRKSHLSAWAQQLGLCDALSRPRLRRVLASVVPAFADVMGDPASHDLNASELWYWRYAIETIEAAGQAAPSSYRRIVFEELAAEPVSEARCLFEWLGLDWTPETEREVARLSANSSGIAKRWTDEVDANERAAIERVLAGSALERWWS
jgi:hypothetical protein